MNKSRHEFIKQQLTWLEAHDFLSDWMLYSPDDRLGKRWVINNNRGLALTLSTNEMELWISGAMTVVGFIPDLPR